VVGRLRRCGGDGSCSDVPHGQGGRSVVLAAVFAGVQQLLGEDPLVALDFAVVPGGERPGLLVPGPGADDAGEAAER
jgi:hypothetical protein